jgi:hypothetical protein
MTNTLKAARTEGAAASPTPKTPDQSAPKEWPTRKVKQFLAVGIVGGLAVGAFGMNKLDRHTEKTTIANIERADKEAAAKKVAAANRRTTLGLRLGSIDQLTGIVKVKTEDGQEVVYISTNLKNKHAVEGRFVVEPEPHVHGGIELVDNITQGGSVLRKIVITDEADEGSALAAVASIGQ